MIIVVLCEDRNPKTGRKEIVVSHGVDEDTMKTIILPQVPVKDLGARFDNERGEYVLSK